MTLPVLRTSERASFRRCPKQWEWGYLDGWKEKHAAQALWMGTGVHDAMAKYYRKGTTRGPAPVKTWLEYCDREHEMVRLYRDEGPEYVEARDLGVAMLEGYVQHWGKDEHLRVLQPEWKAKVRVVVDGKVICEYYLTCDGVVWNEEEQRYEVIEHKTASRVQMIKYQMDDQARTYPPFMTAYLMEKGIIKKPIEHIRYNVLRKELPKHDDRPVDSEGYRLNKDLTRSKNQNVQAPLFVRESFDSTIREQNAQLERIRAEVRAMQWMRRDRTRIYKNYTAECSYCPFRDVCEMHEAGGDYQSLLEWTFTQEDPYDVYRKAA